MTQQKLDPIAILTMSSAESLEYRREPKSFGDTPPTREEAEAGVVDYSTSGLYISKAMRELDEAIPGGQARRAEAAFLLLEAAVPMLRAYLQARGVLQSLPEAQDLAAAE